MSNLVHQHVRSLLIDSIIQAVDQIETVKESWSKENLDSSNEESIATLSVPKKMQYRMSLFIKRQKDLLSRRGSDSSINLDKFTTSLEETLEQLQTMHSMHEMDVYLLTLLQVPALQSDPQRYNSIQPILNNLALQVKMSYLLLEMDRVFDEVTSFLNHHIPHQQMEEYKRYIVDQVNNPAYEKYKEKYADINEITMGELVPHGYFYPQISDSRDQLAIGALTSYMDAHDKLKNTNSADQEEPVLLLCCKLVSACNSFRMQADRVIGLHHKMVDEQRASETDFQLNLEALLGVMQTALDGLNQIVDMPLLQKNKLRDLKEHMVTINAKFQDLLPEAMKPESSKGLSV